MVPAFAAISTPPSRAFTTLPLPTRTPTSTSRLPAPALAGVFRLRSLLPTASTMLPLSAESTDAAALASLPPIEPSIFSSSSQYVGLTAALTNTLGIPGAATGYGAIYGVSPGLGGTNPGLSACVLGTANCYNGVIEVVTPAGLTAETGSQGLWFRDVAGTAGGPQPTLDYDYFSVVEHETDELLGTASCSSISSGPSVTNDCTAGGQIGNTPSAADLFRYSAPGSASLTASPERTSPRMAALPTPMATPTTPRKPAKTMATSARVVCSFRMPKDALAKAWTSQTTTRAALDRKSPSSTLSATISLRRAPRRSRLIVGYCFSRWPYSSPSGCPGVARHRFRTSRNPAGFFVGHGFGLAAELPLGADHRNNTGP